MPPHDPEPWVQRYIGLPFVELGRDWEGADCWGLPRLALLEQTGIEVPSYDTGYTACSRHDVVDIGRLIADGRVGWYVVAEPDRKTMLCPLGAERTFDFLLIRLYGVACHVGLVAGGRHMLHTQDGTDAVCVPYDDDEWRRRIVGIYRHPALVAS